MDKQRRLFTGYSGSAGDWSARRDDNGFCWDLEDPDATPLGEIVYTLGRCRPGFGVKRFYADDPRAAWHSVYCATPNIPAPVLRGLARFAGVHLYNEAGDVLYATPDLLAVHTVAGGERTFQLPHPAEIVYDLYNDCVLARNAGQFAVKLAPASTALYYTGAAETLRSLQRASSHPIRRYPFHP